MQSAQIIVCVFVFVEFLFKLTTSWDDELSFRLGPALAAYELVRVVVVCIRW